MSKSLTPDRLHLVLHEQSESLYPLEHIVCKWVYETVEACSLLLEDSTGVLDNLHLYLHFYSFDEGDTVGVTGDASNNFPEIHVDTNYWTRFPDRQIEDDVVHVTAHEILHHAIGEPEPTHSPMEAMMSECTEEGATLHFGKKVLLKLRPDNSVPKGFLFNGIPELTEEKLLELEKDLFALKSVPYEVASDGSYDFSEQKDADKYNAIVRDRKSIYAFSYALMGCYFAETGLSCTSRKVSWSNVLDWWGARLDEGVRLNEVRPKNFISPNFPFANCLRNLRRLKLVLPQKG